MDMTGREITLNKPWGHIPTTKQEAEAVAHITEYSTVSAHKFSPCLLEFTSPHEPPIKDLVEEWANLVNISPGGLSYTITYRAGNWSG
ncbi:hypothetical protein O9K51_02687 [Purpureocillium lavendulum]|uniref:Uncharacterized protein n=1 Tax=Purpureocillium lavendulum TaxID=1247861 RepID=A0AB34FZ34_9HYPO|nr:hypothetical protein O9K51_02687 [Purpureocillium lavendulum]